MNQRTHRNKKRKARKMMTQEEIKAGIPIFASKAWIERGVRIKHRINKRIAEIRARKHASKAV